jgi:uncharacterized protein with PIN domain
MLGTLAKWLRIYGFDTFYAKSEIDDKKLIEIAKKEKRILLTKDKNLIYKARRENVKTILFKKSGIDYELSKVLNNFEIDKDLVLSRCILCNNKAKIIKKEEIIGKVPNKVFEKQNEFWFCSKCKKIYWKGTHYEKMFEKIKKMSSKAFLLSERGEFLLF